MDDGFEDGGAAVAQAVLRALAEAEGVGGETLTTR
jgi:hypothetical protein